MTDTDSSYYLQSLAMGFKVLQIIAQAPQSIGVSEIARRLGSNSTTITRCCHPLASLGYVSKDSQKHWRLTPKVLSLGYATTPSPVLRPISRSFRESGNSGMP